MVDVVDGGLEFLQLVVLKDGIFPGLSVNTNRTSCRKGRREWWCGWQREDNSRAWLVFLFFLTARLFFSFFLVFFFLSPASENTFILDILAGDRKEEPFTSSMRRAVCFLLFSEGNRRMNHSYRNKGSQVTKKRKGKEKEMTCRALERESKEQIGSQ